MNSFTLSARIPLAAILAGLVLSGCANVLKQYYAASPGGPGAPLSPYSGTTQVYGSPNVATDGERLLQEGYAEIGIVSFKTSGHVTVEQIQDLAAEVGADVVVCSKISLSTHKAAFPFEPAKGGAPGAPNPYVHIDGSLTLFSGNYGGAASAGGAGMDFKGSVSSSGIPSISSEDMAAINADRYEFTATFWRKAQAGAGH
jgi:hypothetical protein